MIREQSVTIIPVRPGAAERFFARSASPVGPAAGMIAHAFGRPQG
jgi:hypothetical protein